MYCDKIEFKIIKWEEKKIKYKKERLIVGLKNKIYDNEEYVYYYVMNENYKMNLDIEFIKNLEVIYGIKNNIYIYKDTKSELMFIIDDYKKSIKCFNYDLEFINEIEISEIKKKLLKNKNIKIKLIDIIESVLIFFIFENDITKYIYFCDNCGYILRIIKINVEYEIAKIKNIIFYENLIIV